MPPKRILRARVNVSYKGTCGAPAPKTTLTTHSGSAAKRSVNPKKASNPISASGGLTYTISGPRLSPGDWCSGCRNGGTVVVCSTCETISFCTDCVDFKLDDGECEFECPPCFLKQKSNKIAEYPHKFLAASSTREHWPKVLTTPLAIISIHLEGMTDTPSLLAYHHLHPWLQGNLVHINMDFNFNGVSYNDFESRLDSMLNEFETGKFREWTQFFVVITTHSDPTSGCLHIAPNNFGSVSVDEILNVIFTERFQAILRRSGNNILNLLACGALSSYEDSRTSIKGFAKRGIFEKLLCFSQPDFQPSATHKFVMDWVLNHFVFERPRLENIIRDHQGLGAHTDIVQFQSGNIRTFRWTHPGARPLGFGINNQCSNCKRLKTRVPRKNDNPSEIDLQCTVCKVVTSYRKPPGWEWVHGPVSKGDERGAWLVHTESEKKNVAPHADSMDMTQ